MANLALVSPEQLRANIVRVLAGTLGERQAEANLSAFEELVRLRAEEGASAAVRKGLIWSAIIGFAPLLLSWYWKRRRA